LEIAPRGMWPSDKFEFETPALEDEVTKQIQISLTVDNKGSVNQIDVHLFESFSYESSQKPIFSVNMFFDK
jgi:hypothetical protein